jgi:hypothetical protein
MNPQRRSVQNADGPKTGRIVIFPVRNVMEGEIKMPIEMIGAALAVLAVWWVFNS